MKTLGIFIALLGVAIFVLPLLGVHLTLLYALGNFRSFAAIILILIGIGVFLFSND